MPYRLNICCEPDLSKCLTDREGRTNDDNDDCVQDGQQVTAIRTEGIKHSNIYYNATQYKTPCNTV